MSIKYVIKLLAIMFFSFPFMSLYPMNPESEESTSMIDSGMSDNSSFSDSDFYMETDEDECTEDEQEVYEDERLTVRREPDGTLVAEEIELIDEDALELEEQEGLVSSKPEKEQEKIEPISKKRPASALQPKKAVKKARVGNEVYSCGICSERYNQEVHFLAHKKFHQSEYRCYQCKQGFGSGKLLASHSCLKYRCGSCFDAFKSANLLIDHKKKIHNIKMAYDCEDCQEAFQTSSALKLHKKNHKQEYACSKCNKKCQKPLDLARHQFGHISGLFYECLLCKSPISRLQYKNRQNFLTHIKQHQQTSDAAIEQKRAISVAIAKKDIEFNDAIYGNTLLILACKDGNVEQVKQLIALGADICAVNASGLTPFATAVLAKHKPVVEELLRQGVDINTQASGMPVLTLATRMLDYQMVKFLLENGAYVNIQDAKDMTALMHATQLCDLKIARLLLSSGANVNLKRNDGATALALCAQNNNIPMARELIAYGADVSLSDQNGQSPLMHAIKNKSEYVINELLKANASIATTDAQGITPLMLAANNNEKKLLATLLNKRDEQNLRSETRIAGKEVPLLPAEVWELILSNLDSTQELERCRSVSKDFNEMLNNPVLYRMVMEKKYKDVNQLPIENFITAAELGNEAAVKAFLRLKVDVNARSKRHHRTALIAAIRKGHLDIVDCLLAADARLEGADIHGMDAFLYSLALNDKSLARLLMKRRWQAVSQSQKNDGIQALLKDAINDETELIRYNLAVRTFSVPAIGLTQLMFIAAANGNVELIDLFIEMGYQLNNKRHNLTPLLIAACNGREAAVRKLVEKGAQVDLTNKAGISAVKLAAYGGHTEIVKFLLAQNPGNAATIISSATIACCEGHEELLKMLVDVHSFDINQPNSQGITPLMNAVSWGNKNIVCYLLAQGAWVNLPDNNGKTALFYAAHWNYHELYNLLLQHGAIATPDHHANFKMMLGQVARRNNITWLKQLLEG